MSDPNASPAGLRTVSRLIVLVGQIPDHRRAVLFVGNLRHFGCCIVCVLYYDSVGESKDGPSCADTQKGKTAIEVLRRIYSGVDETKIVKKVVSEMTPFPSITWKALG